MESEIRRTHCHQAMQRCLVVAGTEPSLNFAGSSDKIPYALSPDTLCGLRKMGRLKLDQRTAAANGGTECSRTPINA